MQTTDQRGSQSDQQVMAAFQYKQELRRTIRLFGSFAVAFSFISITTGIFVNYSDVLQKSGPAGFWTWPIVTVGQLLVALVFAELAARMPLTGYSYQWVTRLAGPGWGWFTGWVAICFLIIVVPSVDHGLAEVIGHMGGFERTSPWLTFVVCITMVIQALIHVSGVRLANLINSVAVFTEVVGMVGLVIVFAVLTIHNQPSLEVLFDRGPEPPAPYWPAFVMACLMGAYTLVGFESAANLSEETVDAARTVPKAVIGSVVVSGVVGTLFLVLTALGIKDLEAVMGSTYPLPAIIEGNLGGNRCNRVLCLGRDLDLCLWIGHHGVGFTPDLCDGAGPRVRGQSPVQTGLPTDFSSRTGSLAGDGSGNRGRTFFGLAAAIGAGGCSPARRDLSGHGLRLCSAPSSDVRSFRDIFTRSLGYTGRRCRHLLVAGHYRDPHRTVRLSSRRIDFVGALSGRTSAVLCLDSPAHSRRAGRSRGRPARGGPVLSGEQTMGLLARYLKPAWRR